MTGLYIVLADVVDGDGAPAALADREGEPVLVHHVQTAQLARLAGPVCVLGAGGDRIEEALDAYPVHFFRSGETARTGVALAALRSVPRENAAFLALGEHLPPRIDTIDLLIEALETVTGDALLVRPRMRGGSGYPLVFLPEGVRRILAEVPADLGAWVETCAERGSVVEVEVDDYTVRMETPWS